MNQSTTKPNGLASPPVKDTNLSSFVEDVIKPSSKVLVLVDFWAEWCGPCKSLTPVLERIAHEAKGAFLLAKINVDDNQELAAQLGIQSIPTVIAFKNGRPVDAFAGALPESEIKKFITRWGGATPKADSAVSMETAEEALLAGEAVRAAQIFSHVLTADASNLEALCGLARAHLKLNQVEEAKRLLSMVPKEKISHPAAVAVESQITFSEKAMDNTQIGMLRAEIEKNPKNYQSRYNLAEALFALGEKDAAAEQLLYIIASNRKWKEEAARRLLLKMFEAAGPKDPFTVEIRRKLSSLLYT